MRHLSRSAAPNERRRRRRSLDRHGRHRDNNRRDVELRQEGCRAEDRRRQQAVPKAPRLRIEFVRNHRFPIVQASTPLCTPQCARRQCAVFTSP